MHNECAPAFNRRQAPSEIVKFEYKCIGRHPRLTAKDVSPYITPKGVK